SPAGPGCERPLGPVTYQVTLVKKTVTVAGTKQTYSYCDRAGVTREATPTQKAKLHAPVIKP
ncbi:MAG TPA: hypothetical protein VGC79_17935, partial [Polyangiaceae bacterium]